MKTNFLGTLVLCLLWIACSDNDLSNAPHPVEKNSITGKLEKGPFTAGSKVVLYELNPDFSQTGKSYRTVTTGDLGHFTFDSPINLASQYAELEINGYFYNETTGELSNSQVTLNTLVDLSDRSAANVNLLTHLEYARVKALVQGGMPFGKAKAMADKELLRVFSITDAISNPEDISLTDNTDDSGILLAISSIMLYNHSEAEFTELISKFSTEFAASGTVTSETVMNSIREGQSNMHPSQIVEDMKTYYATKGTELTINDFSRFVDFNGDGVIDSNDKEDDLQPDSSIVSDDLFQTEEAIKAAISSLYLNTVKATTHQLYLEAIRTGLLQMNTNGLFTPQSEELESLWGKGWNTIANANYILKVLKDSHYSFPTTPYIAETEAIRAFIYYNMTQLWGGLPLRDENTQTNSIQPRKSKAEILQHLAKRIKEAQTYVTETAEPGFMSRWAACMIEAEIRMEAGQYEQAADLLRSVIECGHFSMNLNDNLYQGKTTPEIIFTLWVGGDVNSGFSETLKKGEFQPIYRYTSALLMYAEALNRLGRRAEACEVLTRLGYKEKGEDAASLNHAIVSLWKEYIGTDYGYWALLKRTELAVEELGIKDYEQLFPIPQSEIDFLPNGSQNPGY